MTRDEMLFLFFADLLGSGPRIIHVADVTALKALADAGEYPKLSLRELPSGSVEVSLDLPAPSKSEVLQ